MIIIACRIFEKLAPPLRSLSKQLLRTTPDRRGGIGKLETSRTYLITPNLNWSHTEREREWEIQEKVEEEKKRREKEVGY